MPRMLELFKGTGSVGRVFEANGFDVVSVDNLAKWKPTICVDVLRWNHTTPPLSFFSRGWRDPDYRSFAPGTTGARSPRAGRPGFVHVHLGVAPLHGILPGHDHPAPGRAAHTECVGFGSGI